MLAQPQFDELGHGLCVLIHAPEPLGIGPVQRHAEPRPHRIDEHKVGHIQHAVRIIFQAKGGHIRRVHIRVQHHAARANRAHMDPDGRRSRPAIEHEHDGTVLILNIRAKIGEREYARRRIAVHVAQPGVARNRPIGNRLAIRHQRMLGDAAIRRGISRCRGRAGGFYHGLWRRSGRGPARLRTGAQYQDRRRSGQNRQKAKTLHCPPSFRSVSYA